MDRAVLYQKSLEYLNSLCVSIRERCVGSEGNREATRQVNDFFKIQGWESELTGFDAFDWNDNGAILQCGESSFNVLVSPYSNGFRGAAELVSVSSIDELENVDVHNKIILLSGELATEQLMPKNFVFYNPESHQRIISALEKNNPSAIICATGRNAALAGGVYPFPLIEDGDFDIPSVYMTEEEGEKLKLCAGKRVNLESKSERISGKGYNVIARKVRKDSRRIIVTAHIDSKKGTPGAIDNATGVVVLMLLAELLSDYTGDREIELVALNGEDHYAVPGQMKYIENNHGEFGSMILNINIDGAGYKEGVSAFSLFDLPDTIRDVVNEEINQNAGIVEGVKWPQGDHSIFLQFGVPAIAVTSNWFAENINSQDITHTPKDNIEIVDCNRLVDIALSLNSLIRRI